MRPYLLLLVLGCASLVSWQCTRNRTSVYALNVNTDSRIIGTWHNVSVKVTDDEGEVEVLNVNEHNWEETFSIKPIKTVFRDNHTYYSEYRNLDDSVIRVVEGYWEIMGDSLFLDQEKPEWQSYSYKMSVQKDLATFEGLLDWDGDGEKDDLYIGVQRKKSI